MQTCCDNSRISEHQQIIEIDTYKFKVYIYFCKTCGSLKSRSNITEVSVPISLKSR